VVKAGLAEHEFLVDRRQLPRARVIKQFPELSPEQLDKLFEKEFGGEGTE
jgi:hypothetical protein